MHQAFSEMHPGKQKMHHALLRDAPGISHSINFIVLSHKGTLIMIRSGSLCIFPYRALPVIMISTNRSLQVRKMKYRLPEINDKDILQKYVQEHHNNGETSISASLGLSSSDYTEWVTKIKNNALSGDEQWGKSLLYLCFDGDRLIGLLSVRYELPEVLSEKYGDIGYGVRPSERNKGYATAMLKYALSVCKEKGMEKVILGCYKENLASAATIQKNGGTLIAENENYKEGRTSQYYLIRL